jgi:2-oxoisovalerate dehydrogenase E1 component
MTVKLTKSEYLKLYLQMLIPRLIEEQMLLFLRKGKISKWFSGIGQEAISVGLTSAINFDDVILPMHRNLGVFTTRNVDYEKLFSQLMNRKGGFTKGRDRSFHFGAMEYNIVGMISHLAAMLPVANGFGYGFQLKNESRIAVAFIGDGATSEGDFHEALNHASVWKLPVLFIIENNAYALSTPTTQQYNCKDLIDKAKGYGIPGKIINGNNAVEVFSEISEISDYIRKGNGPYLIEAKTFRMRGHEEASGTKYIPKELMNKWAQKDPILHLEKILKLKKWINDKSIENLKLEILEEIQPIIDNVSEKEKDVSNIQTELNDVYKKSNYLINLPATEFVEMRYVDAIQEGLFQKLSKDKSIVIYGQDIAEYGGVFKVTNGFLEKFGNTRIKNTPIIESGLIGMGLGLSLSGMKPVIEIQFSDFVTCGFNQIVNNLAKTHYRWGENVNVTIRMPYGGGMGAGPFHSQCPESWFFRVPGLKIVAPSNPKDAKGLIISAIDDPNPVLFFEHKGLYRGIKGEVPKNDYHIEIGKANIIQDGIDLSIICYGLAVHWSIEVCKKLADKGYKIEIIDLRTLLPWDKECIQKSVKKTGRVLIIHEDHITGGIGAEISAWICENCFEYLDAPVTRLGSLDTPIPANEFIEKEIFWPKKNILPTIEKLIEY